MTKFALLISAVITLISGLNLEALAAPNEVVYKLKERCGNTAKEFFESRKWPSDDAWYQTHYNEALNGCFLLVGEIYPLAAPKKETKHLTMYEWELWDVNENKRIDVLGFGPAAHLTESCLNAFVLGNFYDPTCPHEVKKFGETVQWYMGQ
jgi:hypothetical protein